MSKKIKIEAEEIVSIEEQEDRSEIINSEEARYFGVPYKLQIWSDEGTCPEGFGEVEVTCANYSTICFKHPKDGHTVPMRRVDFCRWFAFKRVVY